MWTCNYWVNYSWACRRTKTYTTEGIMRIGKALKPYGKLDVTWTKHILDFKILHIARQIRQKKQKSWKTNKESMQEGRKHQEPWIWLGSQASGQYEQTEGQKIWDLMNTVKLYLISRVQIRIENYRKPLNFVVYLPCCKLRLLLTLCSSTNLTEEASSVSFSLWMTRKAHAFGVPFTK